MALTETTGLDMPNRFLAVEAALKGGGLFAIDLTNHVYIMTGLGTPSDGAHGTGVGVCGIGSWYIDYTPAVGKAYINTGSISSPTWTCIGDQS